jgi:hypothetical protein
MTVVKRGGSVRNGSDMGIRKAGEKEMEVF